MGRLRRCSVALLVAICIAAVTVSAQRRRTAGCGWAPMLIATAESFDGGFNFCRIMFSQSRDGDGGGWGVDYPRADVNLSIRLGELTRTRISRDPATGEPNHVLLQFTDDLLFQCPFVMMTEVGALHVSAAEAVRLRRVSAQGRVSSGRTTSGARTPWEISAREIGKVLPPPNSRSSMCRSAIRSSEPSSRTKVVQNVVDQRLDGHRRGPPSNGAESAEPHARAIFDKEGRMMVFITHNTDYGDAFEREGDDPQYLHAFSVDGYAFGINVLLYALSH